MTRSARLYEPGTPLHIIARGNRRTAIFLDNSDYSYFCELLKRVVDRYNWVCHAYCLMGNHYHLLIAPIQRNLDRGMKALNSGYAQKFNSRYKQCGHLFQGRFRSIPVDKDEYFLEVCRYIVLNPTRANLCVDPAEWVWSSHAATAGLRTDPIINSEELLNRFGEPQAAARMKYLEFIHNKQKVEPVELINADRLGCDHLVNRVEVTPRSPEIPKRQFTRTHRPRLEEIFTTEPFPVLVAYRSHNYLLREISDYLGCHYATVSKRLRTEEDELASTNK